MTERAVLSSLNNTTPVRPASTKYLSPATSRTPGISSPATALQNFDDYDEGQQKRERRRKSQAFDIHRRVLGSPSTASPSSTELNGLTSAELASNYANCIKLSTENKITSKNAFGLHLIDYITELLKKKKLDNFQVASSTLDASAKIYAGRVDFIHSSAYKMVASLGGGKVVEEDFLSDEPNAENAAQEDTAVKAEQKIKKKKVSPTVETNLKNINDDKDLEFEEDPMFQVTSAAFDEGGARGLLLNRLRIFDDNYQLVLDSSAPVSFEAPQPDSQSAPKKASYSELKAKLENANLENCQMCSPLSDFHFLTNEWEVSILPKSFSEFAFDASVEPPHIYSVEEEVDAIATGAIDDNDNADGDNDHFDQGGLVNDLNALSLRDSTTAEFVESAISDIAQGSVVKLRQILSSQPSDYCLFNSALLQAWAGPGHWKLASINKSGSTASAQKMTKKKTKKQPFKLTFDMPEEQGIELLKPAKAESISITKRTWATYTKKRTTLPEDKQIDKQEKLFCLFLKPNIKIKPVTEEAIGVDGEIENYDLNNKNDVENFCPVARDEDDEDLSAAGFDFSNETNFIQASQDNSSQGHFTNLTLNGTVLTQDKLVAAPNKVQKISIQYAKSAKRVDVKKLKTTIWSILTKDTQENSEVAANDVFLSTTKMTSPCYFSQLVNTLPSKVSTTMAKNLSIHTVFACLLYITNEKGLKLTTVKEMEDIYIEQDSL
ncbi:condensin complex subunit 2 [Biomphalaria pfeifferi]|uniref:Condensin complex subunit 2 n=1 Tax=Biomphalaria pfeifferi TaxID=112525 RepID=A0AAD8AWS2_BIOPF|nr:condensin complex subunit 2 [Biomphalaria pfeifferi]